MSEKKEINLRIADLAPIPIQTTVEDEESWTSAKDQLNNLWVTWSKRFPKKSSKEILAMIALRFAQVHVKRQNDDKELESILENFEHEIDRMILRDVAQAGSTDDDLSDSPL